MSVVKNRALSLATRGLLGGSVLALATHGLLQTPVTEAPPVALPPAVATGGGSSQYVDYREVARYYKYVSRFKLIIDPHSLSWLSHQRPQIKTIPLLRGHYVSRYWTLRLVADSTATFFDQQQDEEDLLILMALRWLQSDDDEDGGGYFS